MYYVGLDVHSRSSSLEMLNDQGKTVKRLSINGSWDKLLQVVAGLPKPLSICYEASCGYGYLHERLSPLASSVQVAHPGQLRLIFASKRKNDRVDAARIAKLLYLDMVPQVHVPNVEVRQWRGLIEFRRKLLGKRTVVKNQIRALLRGLAIVSPRGLWSKKGLAWFKGLAQLTGIDDLKREMFLQELDELAAKIKRVEKELARIADQHPAVTLLMSIPGVGIRTAEAFVAYIDDVKRFSRLSRIGSYLGLVPCQDASASVNRLGHITKDGPAAVRQLLCEAAWQAVRRSPRIRRWFERLTKNDPDRKKIAIVAVARRLSIVMGAMLRSGETWQESASASARLKEQTMN